VFPETDPSHAEGKTNKAGDRPGRSEAIPRSQFGSGVDLMSFAGGGGKSELKLSVPFRRFGL
jgi:hypothetical protein